MKTAYTLGVTNGLCEHLRARAEIKNCFSSLRATQKFGEHEQASTRLDFASNSSKGKILRAFKNFNGPFITPYFQTSRKRDFAEILENFVTAGHFVSWTLFPGCRAYSHRKTNYAE